MTACTNTAGVPAPFAIERVSTGLSNRNYANEKTFAEAQIQLGPFRFTAYVSADGTVSVPSHLHDDETTLAIEEAVRAAVLEELAVRWAAVERYQRTRSRVVRRCPPPAKVP